MDNQNLVSIITPSFNSSRFIEKTIESVLAQTYTNWELLITDDCSKDNSVEIIQTYVKKDERIKLYALKHNVGAASARNISLDNANGNYIAFLDSDDIWAKDKLKKQIEFISVNDYAFIFSSYDIINEDGSTTGKAITAPSSISYNQYLKNTIIGCLTVVINREKTGEFRFPIIKSSHDMALWLLIMNRGFQAFGMNERLAKYRLVSNSNTAKKWKAAKDVWRVYREIEKLTFIKSVYCFCGYTFNAIIKRI